jgi:2-polyprenyl-3-methyl-5-hydroxy-6-metoxy-1,4-benzoquinol methylase
MADDYVAWKAWKPEDFGRFSKAEARYFDWHLRRAVGGTPPPSAAGLKVLEIGFGNGSFMGWAKARGHRVVGVDISTELVARAAAAGFEAHQSLDGPAPDQRFDLVVALDVMEHIPSDHSAAWLRGLRDRLAPQGRVLLRFPNAESPFGQWYQNGDITHIQALGHSRLRQLAALAELRILHVGERLPWAAQPLAKRPQALLYATARKLFERQLRKMYGLDRGMDFSPNQFVVLTSAASRASSGA